MAETVISSSSSTPAKRSVFPSALRWIPTTKYHIAAAENRLLSLVKTPYTQEQVNIGCDRPGSKTRCFGSARSKPRLINTVTFDCNEGSPTLVMLHGYGASLGFFFRNFDALSKHFRVIAIDLLGWGGSSRPRFTCRSTEGTDAWFVDSFEEWRKAKNLSNFILLGHSFGGYVAAKYALQHPQHVLHLILVGPAGFTSEKEGISKRFLFWPTWKRVLVNRLWESNVTIQKLIRSAGPVGPYIVRRYTDATFYENAVADSLIEESQVFTDYVYHTQVAKASGELCFKYLFSFGALARSPLLPRTSEWLVPTTFIYGVHDWMNYKGAVEARKNMKVPCEIIRIPGARHYVFAQNPRGFYSAVCYACRMFISPDQRNHTLPEGLLYI